MVGIINSVKLNLELLSELFHLRGHDCNCETWIIKLNQSSGKKVIRYYGRD